MKRLLKIIKMLFLLVLIIFLYGFSNKRNERRKVKEVAIAFTNAESPFITNEAVNKLLIQSDEEAEKLSKETIDLKSMEFRLSANPMIRNAEVFLSIDGVLGAKIEQRVPIGRVQKENGESYYLDADGKAMPLSEVYSARVPLITGFEEEDLNKAFEILTVIKADDFMNRFVIGLNKNKYGEIEMDFRRSSLKAILGKVENVEKKFQNFKAFYKKTKQDSTISNYKMVNLKLDNQVIATKK